MRSHFLVLCGNNVGSGTCGSSVERANFNAVVAVLKAQGLRVRVWGVSSVEDFAHGNVVSCGYIGKMDGPVAGDIVWSHRQAHVYVAHVESSVAEVVWRSLTDASCSVLPEPWAESVVGSAGAAVKSSTSPNLLGMGGCRARLHCKHAGSDPMSVEELVAASVQTWLHNKEDGVLANWGRTPLSTSHDLWEESMSSAVEVRHGLCWRRLRESRFSRWADHTVLTESACTRLAGRSLSLIHI